MTNDVIIGIDLGTTNTLASWVPAVEPEIIPGRPRAIVPSVVSRHQGRWIVGDAAQARRLSHPQATLFSIKRLIGQGYNEIKDLVETLPYHIEKSSQGNLCLKVDGETFTPEQIAAEILLTIKSRAEEHLGHPVKKAVITVPAYFDDVQRQSTKQAGEIAGLDVVRIINEPTAAALAYGLGDKNRGNIVVYDLGGGTFDVSILSVNQGVFRVLATAGDTLLGGDDFDNLIMNFLTQSIDLNLDALLMQDLRQVAEKGKIALSTSSVVDLEIQLPEGETLQKRFTRENFEQSIKHLVDKTIACCQQAIDDAQLSGGDIDEVILVGGSTRIPYVRKRVEEFFSKKPHSDLNPDEVVALGAAVQGFILAGGSREILLMDVTPLSLGLETVGGAMTRLIHRNTSIPAQASEEFTTYADNQTGLDLHVLQGERELAQYNRSLGRFRLTGFPPMPAGIPKFKVDFSLDANGVLTLSAREMRSNVHMQMSLTPNRGLSHEAVEKMKKEAIDHSQSDLQAARKINISNEARIVLISARKAFAQVKNQLPEGVTQEEFNKMIEAADTLEKYLDEGDSVMIEFAHEELNSLCVPLADHMISHVAKQLDQKT